MVITYVADFGIEAYGDGIGLIYVNPVIWACLTAFSCSGRDAVLTYRQSITAPVW